MLTLLQGVPTISPPRLPELVLRLPVEDFLRRFLLHLLPRGFMRIRNFGFLANRRRAELLTLGFRLLQQSDQTAGEASLAALATHSLWNCPLCGGSMQVVERLSAAQLFLRSPPNLTRWQRESTSPASNLSRASADTPVLCLLSLKMQYCCAIQTLR